MNVILSSTGSRPTSAQEVTPISLRRHRPAATPPPAPATDSPRTVSAQPLHLHSPSPAILNFTLQNLGLISGSSPRNNFASTPTSEYSTTLSSPLALQQQRSMVFIKPLSPLPVHQSVSPHSVALLSLPQVRFNYCDALVCHFKLLHLDCLLRIF